MFLLSYLTFVARSPKEGNQRLDQELGQFTAKFDKGPNDNVLENE
jgi:hypothetical protein